jgi:hypothetical protein
VHGLERASHLLGVNVIQLNTTVALRTIDDAPKPPKPPRSFVPTFEDGLDRDSFSACMIIKDDNRILNEWFAYHYHTIGLRYVIVTVDPDSETSPLPIFDKWRKFGMKIEVWTDQMFMPDMFFKHQYHLMPQLVKLKKNKHKWIDADKEEDPAETLKLTRTIQDHRFRQLVFLSNCTRELRAKNRTWMVHIDTDEYIVINPKLRQRGKFGNGGVVPLENGPSVVPRLLNEMAKTATVQVNYPCISLPRLMFGSVEDGKQSARKIPRHLFNITKFESLRWKYHASLDDNDRNKQPKVIMDVSAIPEDDPILTEGKVFSIHRPSGALCRMQGQMDFDSVMKYPLSANHYLGTFERFGSRDDPRRNRRVRVVLFYEFDSFGNVHSLTNPFIFFLSVNITAL